MTLSNMLGVEQIPAYDPAVWTVTSPWVEEGGLYKFEAHSTAMIEACQKNPQNSIEFPNVIQGAHQIYIDESKINSHGSPDFAKPVPFYGVPLFSCENFVGGKTLVWKAYTNSLYFARFHYFPRLTDGYPATKFFGETLHIAAGASLLFMAVFGALIFWRKVSLSLAIGLPLACVFFAFYFVSSVAPSFGLPFDMLTTHKISDASLWIGAALFFYVIHKQNLISRLMHRIYLSVNLVACLVIFAGNSVNAVQFGTSLPFGLTFAVIGMAVFTLLTKGSGGSSFLLPILSLGFFAISSINDMLLVSGVAATIPLFPIGMVGGFLFLALSVNDSIIQTYKERDYLQHNLEIEVNRKTQELQTQSAELEKAMATLKNTQAELIQNAKLASLGTLSAGIAHEINNSLNYVNGALPALRKIMLSKEFEDQKKAEKLLNVMTEGLQLTFEIIKSLRSYSGMNQAKFNHVELEKLLGGVLTIIRSKLQKDIEIDLRIEQKAQVYGSVVGLNQVFMNLISNAIDAMPKGGKLTISAKTRDNKLQVTVADTGTGIKSGDMERIFDPFFTTKAVGSGTGIGLHIVKMEIDRHKGNILVESKEGAGTSFHITLPVFDSTVEEAA